MRRDFTGNVTVHIDARLMEERDSLRLTSVPEVHLGVANVVVLLVATICHTLTVGVRPADVVMLLIVALSCVGLPVRYAALTGLSAWGFLTGFVVNDGGLLTFATADLLRLAILVGLGVTVSAVAHSQPRRRKAAYSKAQTRTIRTRATG